LEGNYPLDPNSQTDATMEDFGKFFGVNGIVDSYFETHLADLVDTTGRRWRTRPGAPFQLSADALGQFQRAAIIRDAYFPNGGNTPSIQFELKPIRMDVSISTFLLSVDGETVFWDHGPVDVSRLEWPGPQGPKQVSIRLEPPSASGVSGMREDGPWALLRILDRAAQIEGTEQPGRYLVTFDIGGRQAQWELRASSARNPFRLPALVEFRCPRSF
jgi:type VI secretion system protein ImpL